MIEKLRVTDITSIEIDTTDDTIEICATLVSGGNDFQYEETIAGPVMPDYLRAAARALVEASARAVRDRDARKGPVPCTTCKGACCYKYDFVYLTADDVKVLRANGIDKGYVLFDEPTISGHVGKLEKRARTISGEKIETACWFLRSDGCSIYENRPTVCREYSPWTCGDTYEEDARKKQGRVRLRVVEG